MCGAAAEHQQHEDRREHVDAEEIAASCRAEAAKIGALMTDLAETATANDAELGRLSEQADAQSEVLAQAERELASVLQPQVGGATRALRDSEAPGFANCRRSSCCDAPRT